MKMTSLGRVCPECGTVAGERGRRGAAEVWARWLPWVAVGVCAVIVGVMAGKTARSRSFGYRSGVMAQAYMGDGLAVGELRRMAAGGESAGAPLLGELV